MAPMLRITERHRCCVSLSDIVSLNGTASVIRCRSVMPEHATQKVCDTPRVGVRATDGQTRKATRPLRRQARRPLSHPLILLLLRLLSFSSLSLSLSLSTNRPVDRQARRTPVLAAPRSRTRVRPERPPAPPARADRIAITPDHVDHVARSLQSRRPITSPRAGSPPRRKPAPGRVDPRRVRRDGAVTGP